MSKIYDMYLNLKEKDNETLYLFKCGKFYIFIADDCDTISKYTTLKKVPFTNDVCKCGFPISSLNTYLSIFKNINLKVQVIDNLHNENDIFDKIKSIDTNNMTGLEALNILNELKELV